MKIGIATADDELARLLEAEVRCKGHDCVRRTNLLRLLEPPLDLVFAEWVSGAGLPVVLEGLRQAAARSIPVVVLVPGSAVTSMQRARAAGAADVLLSPPDSEEVRREIEEVEGAAGPVDLVEHTIFHEITRTSLIGDSPTFRRCLEEMRRAARSHANVLLVGETGTGKEWFARAIHQLSGKPRKKPLAVNCSALPGTLLESELFGHVKGAFTGADKDRIGRFEEVGAGTLLLDEIGDVPPELQIKLLRVIEEREFQRLGENQDKPFWGRLICATSVDLEEAASSKRFRRDLLGRINQFRITLPPLRERRGDIRLLVDHFLAKLAKARRADISRSAMEILERSDFPGNVRQLENAILEGLARCAPGDLILPQHLPAAMLSPPAPETAEPGYAIRVAGDLSYEEAREAAARGVDRIYLPALLARHGGNRTRAAEEAGLDRKTFGNRLAAATSDQEGQRDDQ